MESKHTASIRFFLYSVARQTASYWRTYVAADPRFDPRRECLVMILLTAKWICLGYKVVGIGVKDRFRIRPQSVLLSARKRGAGAVVFIHNHPKSAVWPSRADEKLTQRLARAGRAAKVRVLDHIIVADDKHVSIREVCRPEVLGE